MTVLVKGKYKLDFTKLVLSTFVGGVSPPLLGVGDEEMVGL